MINGQMSDPDQDKKFPRVRDVTIRDVTDRDVTVRCVDDNDLLNHRDSRGDQLCHACYEGDQTAVQTLLDLGVDANSSDCIGQLPLCLAIRLNHLEIAELLLRAGSDVNKPDWTSCSPLHVACLMGHIKMVALLLQYGAKVTLGGEDPHIPPKVERGFPWGV